MIEFKPIPIASFIEFISDLPLQYFKPLMGYHAIHIVSEQEQAHIGVTSHHCAIVVATDDGNGFR